MTSSNAIVNAMLGWLKGLASWVLRLFNLSGGFSPLRFLANNWLKLLILLLLVGVAADLLIWLIRWRPHWVWFHKKRVIINDNNFFAAENAPEVEDDWAAPRTRTRRDGQDRRRRNWRDEDYVVEGEVRRRREERERRERERRAAEEEARRAAAQEAAREDRSDVFTDDHFDVDAEQQSSDRYEDKVFRVSDLPRPEDGGEEAHRQRRRERKRTPGASGASHAGTRRAPARRGGARASKGRR